MTLEDQLTRQLDLAEKTAEGNVAVAVGLQAIVATLELNGKQVMLEHERHSTQLGLHGDVIRAHTAQLEATRDLWSRTLEFLNRKPFLVGLAIGVGVTVLVLGPFVMASFAPVLAAGL